MSNHIQKQFLVSSEYHNQRIDSVLAQLLPEYSRSQLSHWIKSGTVLLNKSPCKPKDKVAGNSQIDIDIHLTEVNTDFNSCEPQEIPLNIVYEDNEVLVLNKPAGLVVHPGAGNKDNTLVNALLHHSDCLQYLPRAGIIHRLDKDTTGLLIVAKSLTAHTSLIRQMQERDIQRHYVTLVQGHVISGDTVDTHFGRHPRNRLKMAVTGNGRQAVTHYRIKKQFSDYTLLNVSLMTGRTHQIRVHMAYINHPVFGDQLYGGRMRFPAHADDGLKTLLQQFKRQALHACSISFDHPRTQEKLTFTAPLPDDFTMLLHALEQYDAE